jgi:hypothetical protein
MCPHFAVGKCYYGINCKFKHPGQIGGGGPSYYPPMGQLYDQHPMMNMGYNQHPMMMMNLNQSMGICNSFI